MVFLPLPILLVGILSTPAPREVRRKVLWFTEKVGGRRCRRQVDAATAALAPAPGLVVVQVLGWEVRRPFQVIHVALLVTGAPPCCRPPPLAGYNACSCKPIRPPAPLAREGSAAHLPLSVCLGSPLTTLPQLAPSPPQIPSPQ